MTHFSSRSTLDFSNNEWAAIFIDSDDPDMERTVTVGNVIYMQFFGIKAETINVDGLVKIDDWFSDGWRKESRVLFEGTNINFFSSADIHAGFTLVQADGNIKFEEEAKITSTQTSSCNMNKASNDLFQCISKNSLGDQFALDQYMDVFH